jgi:uncharacterized DUF497 family protein
MSEIRFEWDPRKATSNERKHGVSFEVAESVFYANKLCFSRTRSRLMRKSASFSLA